MSIIESKILSHPTPESLDAIEICFRRLGASVLRLDPHDALPDLLICLRGFNVFIFVKNSEELTERRLSENQKNWRRAWNGPIFVIQNEAHIVSLVNLINTRCPTSALSGFSAIEHMRSSLFAIDQ